MKRFVILVLCLFFLPACAAGLHWSKDDLKNVQTTKKIAKNLLEAWKFRGPAIRAGLGSRIDMLPVEAIKAMDQLDKIARVTTTWTDGQLGEAFGYHILILNELVLAALQKYAPDVFQLVMGMIV